jgi:NAD-dependent SIR2 family protein deacetylase
MNDKRIGLFLGAGASAPFGMPTTKTIKNDLMKKYHAIVTNPAIGIGNQAGVLYSALVSRSFQDIEDVYQALSEWAAFGSGYKYAVSHFKDLQVYLRLVLEGRETQFMIDGFLEHANNAKIYLEDEIYEAYRWKHEQDSMLDKVYSQIYASILGYSKDVRVFTTNYDRAIENFCSKNKSKYQLIDGFIYDPAIGYAVWGNGDYEAIASSVQASKTRVFLYKIHGSLDWKRHRIHGVVRTGVENRTGDPNFDQNLVIYPSISPKQDAEEKPYSDILKNMKEFAKVADCFVVIGYSFRDHNINEIFKYLVEQKKKIIVISKDGWERFSHGIAKTDPDDPNVIFIGEHIEEGTIEGIASTLAISI